MSGFLILGGTGSLGQALTERFVSAKPSTPVTVFSRDEAKQSEMRKKFPNVRYILGDVRNVDSIRSAIRVSDPLTIILAAALKQVPNCERQPLETVRTNITGAMNLIEALATRPSNQYVKNVVGISTDKACEPINAMGASKFMMERVLLGANDLNLGVDFNVCRYGNVLSSRGSVIPHWKQQLMCGEPLTITDEQMTRFLMSLRNAVDLIDVASMAKRGGYIFVPNIGSAKMQDLAVMLSNFHREQTSIINAKQKVEVSGIRPGEKIHETLISQAEVPDLISDNDLEDLLHRPTFVYFQGHPRAYRAIKPGSGTWGQGNRPPLCSNGPDTNLGSAQLETLLRENGIHEFPGPEEMMS